jgi:phytanoyl-CoA hydroxylase
MINPPQAVTMWMALEPVDEQNGCVRYIKGSHAQGMRPHGRTQVTGFSQGISDYGPQDFSSETPMLANAGDLLIHHSMTIHRSDPNTSDSRSRKALGFIYFGESAQEDVKAKQAYQKLLGETSAITT